MNFHPEIILGPPGTGKTTSLLNIVEQEMSNGVVPDRIAYLSFTRRAANEAIERASNKFSLIRSSFPYFRTIHSLCFTLLNLRNYEVLEGNKLQDFANWIGVRITGRFSDDGTFMGFDNGDKILFLENLSRIKMVPLRELYNSLNYNISWAEVTRVVEGLRLYKQEKGLYDFTDMLELYVKTGKKPDLDVLLCDETQDQSALQWKVIEKLAVNTRRVVIAGDDDQAIYEWSGADVPRLINQSGDVTTLNRSYRVLPIVQNLAFSIIDRVQYRRNKVWSPRDGHGTISYFPNFNSVDLSGSDVLVLTRNNFLLKEIIEPELKRNGIIFEKNGYLSVKTSLLTAIMDWERLRSGETLPVSSILNIYDYMSSGISVKRGFKKLPMFREDESVDINTLLLGGGLMSNAIWHEALDRIPEIDKRYIIAARTRGEKILQRPRVRISTIHGAKGGEAEHVVLLKEQARISNYQMRNNPDAEHRVYYVGVTRTKEQLSIVDTSSKYFYPWI